MLVPDEQITTWVDVSGAPLEAKWKAIHEHVTQISDDSAFMALGFEGWREGWAKEAYILARDEGGAEHPETDLFAGDRLGDPRPSALPGQEALRGAVDLAHHDLAVAGRIEEVRLGLVQDDVRPDVDLARSVPRKVSSRVMPSIVGSDQVWSKTKLPSAYQIGLPL